MTVDFDVCAVVRREPERADFFLDIDAVADLLHGFHLVTADVAAADVGRGRQFGLRFDGAGDDALCERLQCLHGLAFERLGGFGGRVNGETVRFDDFAGVDGGIDVVGGAALLGQFVHDGEVVAARAFVFGQQGRVEVDRTQARDSQEFVA